MKERLLVLAATAALTMTLGGAASAAPGAEISQACGTSFGGLVSGAKATGTSTHGNYAGGAAAFAHPATLAAHGCAV
ncbi:MAG TPA: hypothetical protein VK962_00170 [Actinomycetota bacterium]|jgi:hypothetical protein|nr:hypothetical protein [Actinomycetota bacterium]